MAGPSKSSKAGRNDAKCQRYKMGARQELNQLRRLIRHSKRLARLSGGNAGVFSPGKLGKDVATAFTKLNSKLSNVQIKSVCAELHVVLS